MGATFTLPHLGDHPPLRERAWRRRADLLRTASGPASRRGEPLRQHYTLPKAEGACLDAAKQFQKMTWAIPLRILEVGHGSIRLESARKLVDDRLELLKGGTPATDVRAKLK